MHSIRSRTPVTCSLKRPRFASHKPSMAVVIFLLFLALVFPDLVQRLHCALGAKDKCVAISVVSVFQAVMYNRNAIQRSCTPTKEGGKVVVVTGSSGFIGFATTLALKLRGDGVVGIDNFNDYYPVSLKKARAAELASAGVHTVHGDINNIHVLQQIFKVNTTVCYLFCGGLADSVLLSVHRVNKLSLLPSHHPPRRFRSSFRYVVRLMLYIWLLRQVYAMQPPTLYRI